MNIHLLAIDPQNDFCDLPEVDQPTIDGNRISPKLAVPGAHKDMGRLSELIQSLGTNLQDITITLDSHPSIAIERPSLWIDEEGSHVAPFSIISSQDVKTGRITPRFESDIVLSQIERLEAQGSSLMVWPAHCVMGTWGHNIHAHVALAIERWEYSTGRTVLKAQKGEYPWSEHYGLFVADTPLDFVPSTQFNIELARRVTQSVDTLLVAGEASSHCVRASIDQLLTARDRGIIQFEAERIILLTDCMSPVSGFESVEKDFFSRAEDAGIKLRSAAETIDYLL